VVVDEVVEVVDARVVVGVVGACVVVVGG